MKLEVIMIGTATCARCKSIAPVIEEYCSSHDIVYSYHNISDASSDILQMIQEHNIKSAPVFFIYKDDESPIIVSGDEVFTELEKFN